ncbi:MAG: chromate transporter [Spirochaetales bacterium]|nr:chromate transporter [Spirochaetales bacterium]
MESLKINNARIFSRFFVISLFTFGGGYAMLPMVEKELKERGGYLSDKEILDDYALAQSFPGIIGVNASVLMGYRLGGRIGSLFAVLGFISPSIIILTVIAAFLGKISDLAIVKKAFMGLRAGVVALMFNSLLKIAKGALKSVFSYFILIIAGILLIFSSIHPFWIIIAGALSGLLLGGRFDKPFKSEKL